MAAKLTTAGSAAVIDAGTTKTAQAASANITVSKNCNRLPFIDSANQLQTAEVAAVLASALDYITADRGQLVASHFFQ